MFTRARKSGYAAALLATIFVAAASPALAMPATVVTWTADTDLVLSGSSITLQILAGSTASSLSVTGTTFTVTVTASQTFTVRYAGPNPGTLTNGGGASSCHYVAGNNDVQVTNATVTFTPTTTPCHPHSSGPTITPPAISLAIPNGGETLAGGSATNVVWSVSGSDVTGARVSYSLYDGATWTVIATGVTGGFTSWNVPAVATTAGRIRVEAMLTDGTVGATDTSELAFMITAPPAGTADGQGTGGGTDYVPAAAAAASPTINDDRKLLGLKPLNPQCVSGSLIKLPSDGNPLTTMDSTVYFCGENGKRYVFPNLNTFHTWFADFSSVVIISADTMAQIPLGGNATYRPGSRMIKLTTDPKVYAVDNGGVLRWITSEAVAVRLYGPDWAKMVDDLSDAFMADYAYGAPIY